MVRNLLSEFGKLVYLSCVNAMFETNFWSSFYRARGLGQLIRAKNIKTIGDLSTLTPCEIKTLPIRSPKISTVKKALRTYHEQQVS